MQEFPHQYQASAHAGPVGDIQLASSGLPELRTAAPAAFGGPGDRWSPETLLTGAVADCFILTFRAIASASSLPWTALHCEVTGTLDRVDRVTQFTTFDLFVTLDLPAGTDAERAQSLLQRTERTCLISSSLKGAVRLHPQVQVEEAPQPVFG